MHGPPIPLTVAGGHQVNFAAARPVWVIQAPALNARNLAWFAHAFAPPVPTQPVCIVPMGDSKRAAGGPVTELLVQTDGPAPHR